MAQTREGARKMVETITGKYGRLEDGRSIQHVLAGKLGGTAEHTKPRGFACMSEEKHRQASSRGGKISRRTK